MDLAKVPVIEIVKGLIKSKEFSLSAKKRLLKNNAEFEVILVDATDKSNRTTQKKDCVAKNK